MGPDKTWGIFVPPEKFSLWGPGSKSEYRLFISRLEIDNFVFFSSRFIRAGNICQQRGCEYVHTWLFSLWFIRAANISKWTNQINQIRVTTKKPLQQKQTCFLQCFFSLRWLWLGKHFALSWSPYVPYFIYMPLYITNVNFFLFACTSR